LEQALANEFAFRNPSRASKESAAGVRDELVQGVEL
jgi:hypothetical protein